MDKQEFVKIMGVLGVTYNREITQELIKIYYSFLKEYSIEDFKNAIYQIVSEEKYFPSVATIKETIAVQTNPDLSLNAEDEWKKVIEAIHQYGSYRPIEALESLNPVTRSIVERLGYNRLCMADANLIYNYRSSFLKAFENEKKDIMTYTKLQGSNIKSKELENIEGRVVINNLIKQMALEHKIKEEDV